MTTNLDVIGIGNAIVDVLAQAEVSFLTERNIDKGMMTLIDADTATSLYADLGQTVEMSGGSAANTIAAIAAMGGKAGYVGKVADDQLGTVFAHDIRASGAEFPTKPLVEDLPTAQCLIIVTPDADRTMSTYLGACVKISPDDVDPDFIARGKVTYLEGYLFDPEQAKQAFFKACDAAHTAGRQTALSLSDPFCVGRHREAFLDLIKTHIDIVFANADEVKSLFETEDLDHAMSALSEMCEVAVVTRGAEGSTVLSENDIISVDAIAVDKVVDTTGAGDLYAAGFLYGYTQGESLKRSAEYGSIAAGAVIQNMGARVQGDLSSMIEKAKQAA